MSSIQSNAQSQFTNIGLNPAGCGDSTEIVIYYYLEISKSLSRYVSNVYATNTPKPILLLILWDDNTD